MNKMFIAITPRLSKNATGLEIYQDYAWYFDLVHRDDAVPVMMPALSEEEAAEAAERFDGLVITGGEDIEPALYNEENTASSVTDIRIDETDLRLYRAFRALGKPVLGICRGLQLINVAEGGTLMQDIPSENPDYHEHSQYKVPGVAMTAYFHDVVFSEGTRLAGIFGDRAPVNSFHHQAIRKTAPGFTVSAVSDDGIIEGIERGNVLAVQWHPERLQHDERETALADAFLEDCRNYRRRP